MDEAIKKEQEKLANHMKKLSSEERQKQGFGLMCWLQGYEVGYQSAQNEKETKK